MEVSVHGIRTVEARTRRFVEPEFTILEIDAVNEDGRLITFKLYDVTTDDIKILPTEVQE